LRYTPCFSFLAARNKKKAAFMDTPAPSDEEEIFLHAVGLTGDERVVFLNAACAGQPALRDRLDQLLAWQNDDSFLESSPFPPLTAEGVGPASEHVGAQIGPYRLLEELGAGGFGTVWRAQQERPVRRQVALKIVKLGMDTKEVMARFEQERQALALMEHPSIARVFDAGATQAGRPFFVMELVRGVRITEYCDTHNLSIAERLDLFIQVCQAVQHAHQKGVIHRDLKPSNVLVAEQDGVPLPKVIDFGVAKATEARLTDLTLVTEIKQLVGTPLYMSPEQAAGGVDIDTRADIYALGVLLYELLTGCTPFEEPTKTRAGTGEALRISRERGPKRPSTMLNSVARETRTRIARQRQTDGPRLLAEVRGDLDWIVLKALEHDRARRYARPRMGWPWISGAISRTNRCWPGRRAARIGCVDSLGAIVSPSPPAWRGEMELATDAIDDEVLAVHEALDQFARSHPRQAELVKLRYFVGMNLAQAAEALEISEATAKGDWSYARAWLGEEIRRGR
jgi:serine/threonine protein kinase